MDRKLIDAAAGALSVQAVLLRSSTISASEALLPPADINLSVVGKYRREPADEFEIVELTDVEDKADTVVIFCFRTGIRLIDHLAPIAKKGKKKPTKEAEPSEGKVHLEILAEFAAHYRLRPGSDVEALKSAFTEFGNYNVGLHVWPYWREYVQSTCARMGIPPISVGMYNLSSAKPKARRG